MGIAGKGEHDFEERRQPFPLHKHFVGAYTCKPARTTVFATLGRNRDAATYADRDIDSWSMSAKYALTNDSELFTAWVDRSEDAFGTTPAKDYQILTLGINAKFGY